MGDPLGSRGLQPLSSGELLEDDAATTGVQVRDGIGHGGDVIRGHAD
jgi:hypothetical protein